MASSGQWKPFATAISDKLEAAYTITPVLPQAAPPVLPSAPAHGGTTAARSKTDAALAEATAQREQEEKNRLLKEAENEQLKIDLDKMRQRLELQDVSRRRSLEREGAKQEAEDSAAKHAAAQRERELELERDKAELLATKAKFDAEEARRLTKRKGDDDKHRQELAKLQAQRESIADQQRAAECVICMDGEATHSAVPCGYVAVVRALPVGCGTPLKPPCTRTNNT